MKLLATQRGQIAALDDFCDEYGLDRGVFTPGRKHGKYTVHLPNGCTVFVPISKTPSSNEWAIQRNVSNLRINIAKAMGWAQ